MELRGALALFGSVLAVVLGYPQCTNQWKCIPFNDCLEYQSYVGIPHKSWPQKVQNEVGGLLCGVENLTTGKIYKLCCTPKPSGRDLLDLEKCGRQSEPRIKHGEIAQVFAYPWMALLGGNNGKFHCGGSLIAESFVLTAAHCRQKKVTFVRVGETDLSTPIDCNDAAEGQEDCADPYQDIRVAEFIKHENYSSSNKKNDIALIKLASPAQLNHSVRPICLPLPEMLPRKLPRKMTVTGWGYTEDKEETSNQLRFASITVLEHDQCQRSLRQLNMFLTLDESQVCTGDKSDRADHCKGDSGGPLQYVGTKGFVIHGVVSFGLSICGKERAPGVYTKVAQYVDWIIDKLK